MSTKQAILDAIRAWEQEDAKFESGNSAAGTRARKALAEAAKAIKLRRNEITAEKNARKEAKAQGKWSAMMEHPFIDPGQYADKSIEDMEKLISDLYGKVKFAQVSRNNHMANQIFMAIESHKKILQAKIDAKYGNAAGNTNNYNTVIDISWMCD